MHSRNVKHAIQSECLILSRSRAVVWCYVAVAAKASYLAARKAASADPMEALRAE